MATTKIAAIMRAGAFSPNHIGNDATIMNTVAEQLRKRGCEVNIYSEEQFCTGNVSEPVVINMCREQRSTELLQRLEDEGTLVINSGYGIENCIRERQARILLGSNIPYPESIIVDTDEVVKQRLIRLGMQQCWIKRGDFHTQHAEDVSYVRSPHEAQDVLQEYFLRGFKRAVISRHLPGKLVKFYGVAGTNFSIGSSLSNRKMPNRQRRAPAHRRTAESHLPESRQGVEPGCLWRGMHNGRRRHPVDYRFQRLAQFLIMPRGSGLKHR